MLKFCVLGYRIQYTLSPVIHGAVFDVLGVNATYGVEDIPSEELESNIPRLREYDGFNVTKPHKLAILPYLDEVLSPISAVNTVKRSGDRLAGYNTDVGGFGRDIRSLAGDLTGVRTLVLGAGGAAEAVVCSLTGSGADVAIINRTKAKAEALAARYGASVASELKPQVIVNCTSAVNDGGEFVLPAEVDASELKFAYDLTYSPPITPFMAECERRGAKTANGLGMLVRQAIEADEIFLGRQLDGDALFAEVMKVLQNRA